MLFSRTFFRTISQIFSQYRTFVMKLPLVRSIRTGRRGAKGGGETFEGEVGFFSPSGIPPTSTNVFLFVGTSKTLNLLTLTTRMVFSHSHHLIASELFAPTTNSPFCRQVREFFTLTHNTPNPRPSTSDLPTSSSTFFFVFEGLFLIGLT